MTLLIVFVLAGCGKAENPSQKSMDDEMNKFETTTADSETVEQGLKLQVLKGDAEAGATLDNNELYIGLNKIVQENPDIGIENDFSIYVVNIVQNHQGNSKLVLLGINKLPVPIKNFAFDYTLGNQDNEFVWEKQRVSMAEQETGVLDPNSAVPVILSLTPEQEELLRTLDENNEVMAIENFTFEEVK